MIELYLLLTALVILLSMLISYQRTSDPLSPLFTFTPMLFYVYVYHPYTLLAGQTIHKYFPDPSDIEYVLLLNLLCLAGFCVGACRFRRAASDDPRFRILEQDASQRVRRRFLHLSLILGTMASLGFWWMVFQSGGPQMMWRQPKPSLGAASGYIGEMPMLTYPAMLLLAAAWQGRPMTLERVLVALYIASPQISWAILGKRRGTIFLIAATLAAFWSLVRNKRPNGKVVLSGVGMLGLFLLFVAANRSSGTTFDLGTDSLTRLSQTLQSDNLDGGDEFISATALVLTSDHFHHHYWGKRFFALFAIRPIPSFLWERKWIDLDLAGLQKAPGLGGMSPWMWRQAVGFLPTSGSAGGFVSDAFLEWGWGAVVVCYGLGYFFSWLWKQWVSRGGVWTLVYIEAMILCVHLPSQSLGSWAYRFALLAVPTFLFFRLFTSRKSSRRMSSTQGPIPMVKL